MRALVLVMLLAAGTAQAQEAIFKCVDANGAVAYQNEACPDDAKVADIRQYEPLTAQEEWQARQDRARREAAHQQRQETRQAELARVQAMRQAAARSQPRTPAQTQRQRCVDARSARDRARKNAPLWRPIDYLGPLDDRVHKECNGIW